MLKNLDFWTFFCANFFPLQCRLAKNTRPAETLQRRIANLDDLERLNAYFRTISNDSKHLNAYCRTISGRFFPRLKRLNPYLGTAKKNKTPHPAERSHRRQDKPRQPRMLSG